jgi:hypothetical protein
MKQGKSHLLNLIDGGGGGKKEKAPASRKGEEGSGLVGRSSIFLKEINWLY